VEKLPVPRQCRTQFREPGFFSSFSRWADSSGLSLVPITTEVLGCWHALIRLPLGLTEQFSIIVSLCGASKEDSEAWIKALNEAVSVADMEHKKMMESLNILWRKTAKELAPRARNKATARASSTKKSAKLTKAKK
jgi:hypothetical protein